MMRMSFIFMRYLALLRGINVGGKNIIKMADLKACFEAIGMEEVQPYIQSGNVIFSSSEKDVEKLRAKIQRGLKKTFSYEAPLLVVTQKDLETAVKKAPRGFGDDLKKYRCDVLFLFPELKAGDAVKEIQTREGVDEIWKGKRVIYFRRLTSLASRSLLSKIVQKAVYQQMTIRNWNTTMKLLKMMEDEA